MSEHEAPAHRTEALAHTIWVAARHLEQTLLGYAPDTSATDAPLPTLTPAAQHWLFETWRRYAAVHLQLAALLTQPPPPNPTPNSPAPPLIAHRAIEALLFVALTIHHAKRYHAGTLCNEAVKATLMLEAEAPPLPPSARPRTSFKALVNAILRRAATLDEANANAAPVAPADFKLPCLNVVAPFGQPFHPEEAHYQHPRWWLNKLHFQYGDEAPAILAAGNQHAPMSLRINRLMFEPDAAIARLASSGIAAEALTPAHFLVPNHALPRAWESLLGNIHAVRLQQPMPVGKIPEFQRGGFSVQDAAAQVAVVALQINHAVAQHGRVLDACAAPGGKSGQIAEILAGLRKNDAEEASSPLPLLALEKSAFRAEQIRENQQRLGLSFAVQVGDLSHPETWWDGQPFDRILLDVPCSSSGSMRRHPDGKWRLVEQDIIRLALAQKKLLHDAAKLLKPDGLLVYSTCSLFAEENGRIFTTFCQEWQKDTAASLPSAVSNPILSSSAANKRHFNVLPPLQWLPHAWHDGHFVALWSPTITQSPLAHTP